jgi:hypothetical protein
VELPDDDAHRRHPSRRELVVDIFVTPYSVARSISTRQQMFSPSIPFQKLANADEGVAHGFARFSKNLKT